MARTSDFEESELISILDDCLQEFPNIQVLRKEQQLRLVNLDHGKDIFAILPTGFGKNLIFQLFPRLAKAAAMKSNVFDRGCLSLGLSDAGPSGAAKTAWILCGSYWTWRRIRGRRESGERREV